MANEVKLYGSGGSPFVCRVIIALKMKGIEYENFEEDMGNKSADLLKYNPVHKKVPVLVHNGNPIAESLVIVEYIDDVWKGVPILPQDPYEKAGARFWAKFVDDKHTRFLAAMEMSRLSQKLVSNCKYYEKELKVRGTKFFGGDNINIVDLAADFLAYWLGTLEEATEIEFFTKDKFPKLTKWADDFVNCEVVK